MSVLIKGMKMPENCTICRFCVPEADPENGEMCMATGRFMPPCSTERLEECPLVEVPTPHGPLIDMNEALHTFSELEPYRRAFGKMVLIEAEEGEEK